MTNKKLFELLKLVGGVNYSYWRMVNALVDCIKEDESVVVEKEWKNFKKDFPDTYKLDLSKLNTWSTSDMGVTLNFENINDRLYCKARIYECDNFDGHRKELRFTATLILPNKFLKQIDGTIESYFESYLLEAYEAHLENQKKLFVYNLRNEILNKK